MNKIDNLLSEISETRNKLLNHTIYNKLNDINSISKFMEIHVFAVWDFMSLTKSLQKILTCVETPWYPTKDKISPIVWPIPPINCWVAFALAASAVCILLLAKKNNF